MSSFDVTKRYHKRHCTHPGLHHDPLYPLLFTQFDQSKSLHIIDRPILITATIFQQVPRPINFFITLISINDIGLSLDLPVCFTHEVTYHDTSLYPLENVALAERQIRVVRRLLFTKRRISMRIDLCTAL